VVGGWGSLGVAAIGGHVKAFVLLDGWGVPLVGNFPIHRLSHDYFTQSSAVLGSGNDSFYESTCGAFGNVITANCSGMLGTLRCWDTACASDCYRFFDYAVKAV